MTPDTSCGPFERLQNMTVGIHCSGYAIWVNYGWVDINWDIWVAIFSEIERKCGRDPLDFLLHDSFKSSFFTAEVWNGNNVYMKERGKYPIPKKKKRKAPSFATFGGIFSLHFFSLHFFSNIFKAKHANKNRKRSQRQKGKSDFCLFPNIIFGAKNRTSLFEKIEGSISPWTGLAGPLKYT